MLTLLPVLAVAGPPSVDSPVHSGELATPDAAVVLAVEDYRFLPDREHAVRDATSVVDTLVHTRGVPPEAVRRLIGPSNAGMSSAIADAARKVGRDGTLWIYFVGRCAALGDAGDRVLLDGDAPKYESELDVSALRLADIPGLVSETRAGRVLVMLECDFDRGASPISYKSKPPKGWPWPEPDDARIAVMAATTADGAAHFEPETDHGAFTYHLLAGLRGWADGSGKKNKADGSVTLGELASYVAAGLEAQSQAPRLELSDDQAAWELVMGRLEAAPAE